MVTFRHKLIRGLFCASSASRLHLNAHRFPVVITDRNSLLNTGYTVVLRCSSSCGCCCSAPPSHWAALVPKRGDGTTMSLIFFKAAGLVNALIFMLHHWINHHCSVAPFKQTSAQLSHEPTFLFSLFLIFIRRVSLCAPRSLRRRVRDQAGAGKDSVSCSKTL